VDNPDDVKVLRKGYPEDAAVNPDFVLEQAVGKYQDCLILGYTKEGYLEVRATLGLKKAEVLLLLEQVRFNLLAGYYDEDTE